MAESVVKICNMALGHIRGGSINDLDEASVQAQQCKLFYSIARDQMLKESLWGFNHCITPLQRLTTADVFDWPYVWQYPNDCLQINNVIRNIEETHTDANASLVAGRLYDHQYRSPSEMPRVEYRIFNVDDNKVIASREPELRIDYQKKVTNVALFPDNFTMALSYLLAHYIAVPVCGVKDGRQFRSDTLGMYMSFLNEAKNDDANQQYVKQPDSEYITVRE